MATFSGLATTVDEVQNGKVGGGSSSARSGSKSECVMCGGDRGGRDRGSRQSELSSSTAVDAVGGNPIDGLFSATGMDRDDLQLAFDGVKVTLLALTLYYSYKN